MPLNPPTAFRAAAIEMPSSPPEKIDSFLPPPNSLRWIAVLPALVVPLIGALIYNLGASETSGVQAIYGGTKVFTLIWPFIALSLLFFGRGGVSAILSQLPRMRATLSQVGVGLALGLIIVASSLLLIFGIAPIRSLLMGAVPEIRAQTEHMGVMGWFIPFALLLSFAHSLLEEVYWRWFCYGQLRELLIRPLAHLVAGVGFAAHHVVVLTQFFPIGIALLLGAAVGIGGIFWSLLYQRQGTLAGAWASHIIVDLGIFGLGYWLIFS